MHKPKFRIWSKTLECFITDLSLENLANPSSDQLNDIFNNGNLIFQQWTGFIDSNNIEIYEGDIVENNKSHITFIACDCTKYTKGIVKIIDTSFKICQKYIGTSYMNEFITCDCCPCGLTITGNILQNKDLLEK